MGEVIISLEKIILAIDNQENRSREEILSFLEALPNDLLRIKIGLELFCRFGPSFVEEAFLRSQKKIFLDLKLHDIPNTVAKSLQSLKGLPLEFITIHLSGGRPMLEKALQLSQENLPGVKLLGVSYLTSLGERDFRELWGFERERAEEAQTHLFRLAFEVGIHGLVLSPLELKRAGHLEKKHAVSMIKVCPGIRFQAATPINADDQKRVLTPEEALQGGADFLVMGRSLMEGQSFLHRLEKLRQIPSLGY